MTLSKPIQSQIMMDTFDSQYAMEMTELFFLDTTKINSLMDRWLYF